MENIARRIWSDVDPAVAAAHAGGPIPERLHMGKLAYEHLRTAAHDMIHNNAPRIPDVGATFLGVPVVVGALNSALPLDPWGWRLLDRDGNVLAEGVYAS